MAGNQPDIRVRLSAEGQQEVVKAFKKISAEAVRTGKKGSKGISLLNNSLKTFRTLLPTIAIGAVVAGIGALIKSSIDAADALAKMSQRTGVSVETLSALKPAAELADASLDDLGTGLGRLARVISDAQSGLETAVRPFRDLGIEVTNSDGTLRSLEDVLNDVSKEIAGMADGTKKTALAQELMGRGGTKLIPLMNDLGKRGFAVVKKEAEEMAAVLSGETAAAAADFNDNLGRLKTIAGGVGLSLIKELLPSLIAFSDGMVETAKDSGKLSAVVAGLASVFKVLLNVVSIVTAVFSVTGTIFRQVAAAALNIADGEFAAAWESISQGARDTETAVTDAWNDIKGVWVGTAKDIASQADRISDQLSEPVRQTVNKIQQAAARLEEQLLKNELALLRASLKLQAAEEQIGFDRRITSLNDFFGARRRIIKQQAAAEIEILEKRVAAERARPLLPTENELDRKKKLSKLESDIAVRRLGLEQQLLVLFGQERNLFKQTQKEVEDFERKLLALQGDRFAVARAELQDQLDQFEKVLERQGVADEDRRRRIAAFATAGEGRIAFDEIKEAGRQALADLAGDRRAIEAQVQQGLLFQFQGENQIRTLEQQRLPVLREIADALLKAALATGDPELIAGAQDFTDSIRDIGIESNRAAQEMVNFRASIEQSLTSDLNNFFLQGIENAEGFGDAMRSLALSVVDSLRDIAAQMLATLVIQKLLGAFGLPGLGGGGGLAGGGAVGAAGGGLIVGPGSTTSDSIPVRLSRGEYVVRSKVVSEPDVLAYLNRLNREGRPALRSIGQHSFAEGGLVETNGAGARAGANGKADLTIGLDESLLLKRLEASPMFSRVLVRTLDRHRKKFNNALGRGVQ